MRLVQLPNTKALLVSRTYTPSDNVKLVSQAVAFILAKNCLGLQTKMTI